MGYRIEYGDRFKDGLSKIDLSDAQSILLYLNREIGSRDNPRTVGYLDNDYWKYSTCGKNILVVIDDEKSTITAVAVKLD